MPENNKNRSSAEEPELKRSDGITVPAWIITLIFSFITGIATYAYIAGQKTDELARDKDDIREIREEVKEINRHLEATDAAVAITVKDEAVENTQIQTLNRLLLQFEAPLTKKNQ